MAKTLFDAAMAVRHTDVPNIRQAVPFLGVKDKARGLQPAKPFVGNGLWVTSLVDPDGYRLDFESPTDISEDTVYSEPA